MDKEKGPTRDKSNKRQKQDTYQSIYFQVKKKTKGKQTKKEERGKSSQTNEYEKEGEDDGKRKGANKKQTQRSLGQQK